MSILGTITQGVSRSGIRMVIAGQEKMGKTTLLAGAPDVLIVPLEIGTAGVQAPKTGMIATFEDFQQLMLEIKAGAQQGTFKFKTVGFDSVTALERLIHDSVLRADPVYKPGSKKTHTMESAHGGYGKAYNLANDMFSTVLQQFDELAVYAGINIILTAHVFASELTDPNAGKYSSWDLLLHSPKNEKTYGKREIITQWADIIGFIYEPMFVSQANDKAMARASSQGKGHVMGLKRTASYVAGNRFGIVDEVPIPAPPANGWNALAHVLYQKSGIDLYNRQVA